MNRLQALKLLSENGYRVVNESEISINRAKYASRLKRLVNKLRKFGITCHYEVNASDEYDPEGSADYNLYGHDDERNYSIFVSIYKGKQTLISISSGNENFCTSKGKTFFEALEGVKL